MDALYKVPLLIRCGNFFFRFRNAVFPLVLVPAILFVTPAFPDKTVVMDRWLDIPILAIGVLGEALRVLVVGYAYVKRGGVDKRIYAESLVTRGVFGHSRNPLYVGNGLIILSLLLMADSLWGYVLAVPFFVFAYVSIIAAEEQFLRRKFGPGFDDYCRRVNRWFPNFSGFRQSIEGMRFDWRRVVVKEYSSVFSWILGILAIEANETLWAPDIGAHAGFLAFLSATLVVALVAFFLARYYKKSGAFQRAGAGR